MLLPPNFHISLKLLCIQGLNFMSSPFASREKNMKETKEPHRNCMWVLGLKGSPLKKMVSAYYISVSETINRNDRLHIKI